MNLDSQNLIRMQVKLADFLAKMVSEAKFDMKIEAGTTVEEFMIVLTERFGEKFRRAILDPNGKLNADIAVVLNNRFIPPQQMTKHAIQESGKLSIIPIAGGG